MVEEKLEGINLGLTRTEFTVCLTEMETEHFQMSCDKLGPRVSQASWH